MFGKKSRLQKALEKDRAEFEKKMMAIRDAQRTQMQSLAIPQTGYITRSWGSTMSIPVSPKPEIKFPDETEPQDKERIGALIEAHFETAYPEFEPEIVNVMSASGLKEYYLPALKVLVKTNEGYFSPNRVERWENGELRAVCKGATGLTYYTFGPNGVEPVEPSAPEHDAPYDGCDCGIYGSVNIEEIQEYLYGSKPQQTGGMLSVTIGLIRKEGTPVLCLIEPMPDADVFLCRKGWRASAAFVSEIVSETISMNDASNLLSLAWKRELDVRKVFNESR